MRPPRLAGTPIVGDTIYGAPAAIQAQLGKQKSGTRRSIALSRNFPCREIRFPSRSAAKSFISLRPYRPNWNNSWHFSMLNSSENAAIMGYPMRASRFVLSAVCVGAVSVAVAQNASDSLPSAPSAVIQEEQKKAQAPPPAATRAAPAPQAQEKPTELTNTPPAPVSNPPSQQEPPAATPPAPTTTPAQL